MSDDLYNECLDDAQVLINLALKKLQRANKVILGRPGLSRYVELSQDIEKRLTTLNSDIDSLPGLGDQNA
jgi:hypothetical protein